MTYFPLLFRGFSGELYGKGSWWAKAKACDIFVLLDTVKFTDNSYTQRARRSLNGERWLTVPCKHPRLGKLINEIEIDWLRYHAHNHIATLTPGKRAQNGYKQRMAPYLAALRYGVLAYWMQPAKHNGRYDTLIGESSYKLLADWNTLLILKLAIELGVKCEFRRASHLKAMPPEPLTADQCLAAIVEAVGGDTYLTGPNWVKYAPHLEEVLNEHGIKLEEI